MGDLRIFSAEDVDDYITWRNTNRDVGFVLNPRDGKSDVDKVGTWMLHRASCRHFYEEKSLQRFPKVVSANAETLRVWVRSKAERSVEPCVDCKP